MSNHLFYFMGAIFSLIAWTVGGFVIFGICAFIREALEPHIGGFAWLLAIILFFVLLIFLAGIVPYPGDLEPGRPRFFGDSQ